MNRPPAILGRMTSIGRSQPLGRPDQTGVQAFWIPAFAGMTGTELPPRLRFSLTGPLLFVGLLLLLFLGAIPIPGLAAEGLLIEVTTASAGSIIPCLTFSGTLMPVWQANLAAPAGGRLQSLGA